MIKFKLREYDVEISAVNNILKNPEKDVLYLLNQLSIISGLAATEIRNQGYGCLADGYKEFQNDFYNVCREHGLYKEVDK